METVNNNNEKIVLICTEDKDFHNVQVKDTFNNGWYFHGRLEDDLHYDVGAVLEVPDKYLEIFHNKFLDKDVQMLNLDGKFDVTVHGINKPCIGYFWVSSIGRADKIQRGLICYADDLPGLALAKKKYDEKSVFI